MTSVAQLSLHSLSADQLDSWRALCDRAVEPNPFFEPEFVLAAARTLGEPSTALLVAADSKGWQACLPVQRARVDRAVPILRTWNHLYCFLGTPLLDRERAPEAARALLEGATRRAPGSLVAIELLAEDGPAGAAMHQAAESLELSTLRASESERALLARRPDGDYLAGMRSHRRRELNRLGRRLEAELGGELQVTDLAGQEGAVDRFLDLERSGWKGRGETALASTPRHEEFFRSICSAYAEAGRLQLLALSVDTRPVAMKCNLVAGDGAFCFKIAYDEQLAAFSPGVQLERENITVFHEQRDESWQDSCADPDNAMINRLWPDRRRLSNTIFARPGLRTSIVNRGLLTAQRIRTRDRRTPSARS